MLALGTGPGTVPHDQVTTVVSEWLALGGRHIDTALEYNSQTGIGAALRNSTVPRAEVFVTSKIPGPVGGERAVQMVGTCLDQLGLQYIDLMLVH